MKDSTGTALLVIVRDGSSAKVRFRKRTLPSDTTRCLCSSNAMQWERTDALHYGHFKTCISVALSRGHRVVFSKLMYRQVDCDSSQGHDISRDCGSTARFWVLCLKCSHPFRNWRLVARNGARLKPTVSEHKSILLSVNAQNTVYSSEAVF
jgi:hypothetical protein